MTGKLIWAFSDSWTESLRFTLSPQVIECPYQLPSHCSSLYVLLSIHKSLNAHINFQVIVRLSSFYSQSTNHWMPISTSQSLFVSLRFTLSPQVTECPTCGLRVKRRKTNKTGKLIWAFSDLLTASKTKRDEQWLGSWYGHSVTCGLRVKRRETNNDWEVDTLNAHINFPVIVRLSTFYAQSTIHWMPISTSQSLFVSLRFTLSPQFTECPCGLRVKWRETNNEWEVDMGIQWLVDWE
jgi:hypothetical protein